MSNGAQINAQELFAIIGEKEVALIKLREAATALITENQTLRDKVVAFEEAQKEQKKDIGGSNEE